MLPEIDNSSLEAIISRVESGSRKGIKIDLKAYLKEKINRNPGCFDKFPDINHLTLDNTNIGPSDAAKKIIEHYKP